MTVDELAAKTGSTVSSTRPIVYTAQHKGKDAFFVGNFTADRHATNEEILAKAEAGIEQFYARHMPDGTARPKVIDFQRGALFLSLD